MHTNRGEIRVHGWEVTELPSDESTSQLTLVLAALDRINLPNIFSYLCP